MKAKIKTNDISDINEIVIKPVKKYAPPKYPTLVDATHTPELLRKLPTRWEKNAKVIAALGLLGAMTLNSCGGFDSNNANAKLLNVAPLFVHGEGTGSIGCDMIAPPVFLSEQEALAIIKNETESVGLNFNATPPEYIATDNKSKETSQYSWEKNQEYILGDGKIGLDLYDKKNGVAVSFVSMDEAAQKFDGFESSVTNYLPRELAELTVEDFAKQNGDISVGVFYDPGTDWQSDKHQQILSELHNYDSDKEWSERLTQYQHDTRELIIEDLRQQVRDFIEWLQGQGII